jgi:large subunit ribosomal protein L3
MAEMKGILGRKVGMTQVFDDNGRAIPVTVVEAGPCSISQIKRSETDGYSAIQLAFGKAKRVNRPAAGHLAKANLENARYLVELRVDDTSEYSLGMEIKADVFEVGAAVDVVGVTKGKGFAGAMKRHHFSGLSATHGTQRKHRSPGSIGAAATPSRVFKGMRMAGHMGNSRVTTLNLEIIKSDPERNLLLIKGAVPGPRGGLVMVRSAIRAVRRDGAKKKAS